MELRSSFLLLSLCKGPNDMLNQRRTVPFFLSLPAVSRAPKPVAVQKAKPVFGKKELSEAEQRAKSMDEMFEKAKKDAEDDEPHVRLVLQTCSSSPDNLRRPGWLTLSLLLLLCFSQIKGYVRTFYPSRLPGLPPVKYPADL
jgi:hypothetical protein